MKIKSVDDILGRTYAERIVEQVMSGNEAAAKLTERPKATKVYFKLELSASLNDENILDLLQDIHEMLEERSFNLESINSEKVVTFPVYRDRHEQ